MAVVTTGVLSLGRTTMPALSPSDGSTGHRRSMEGRGGLPLYRERSSGCRIACIGVIPARRKRAL
jgi:hypothetical protein